MTNFIHGLQLLTAGRVKFVKKLKRSKKLRKKRSFFVILGKSRDFNKKYPIRSVNVFTKK